MTPQEINSALTASTLRAARANELAVILVGAVSALCCIAAVPLAVHIAATHQWAWAALPAGAEMAAIVLAGIIMRRAGLRHAHICRDLGATIGS